ncbi:MAG: MBL fold metallo-hydrolase [Nitriliruptorales bacterium]|nr:MBL fold metallo-hydrolase [Nitriliruptorales bacterium]
MPAPDDLPEGAAGAGAGQPPLRWLDEVTAVVLAPNPSPMTLEGTNTYLMGQRGRGDVVLIDPGPDLVAHRAALDASLRWMDATVSAVVLTHHHADHAEAAGWADDWGAVLHAFTPDLVPAKARPLPDGATVGAGGVTLEAVHTPGHASDHLCLKARDTGVVLTGDHVLGRGTTVVAWPDGDMREYMASLERLGGLSASALYPGHGPALHDPAGVIAEYLAHRREREQQVLDAVAAVGGTPGEIVARVYADVDPVLYPAAERSVRAHLRKLVIEGRVRARGDTYSI